jgi:hypothetical protein
LPSTLFRGISSAVKTVNFPGPPNKWYQRELNSMTPVFDKEKRVPVLQGLFFVKIKKSTTSDNPHSVYISLN